MAAAAQGPRTGRPDRARDPRQLLFSGDDQKKALKVISGGEGQRMLIGKLVLQMPN